MISIQGACPLIYGPVPSRRHGRSLGINLGSPSKKICTWGCLYCQCGTGERRDFTAGDDLPGADQVIAAFKEALRTCGPIDSVTFAGNSEPASHPEFLKIVRGALKVRYAARGSWILNCLSNGSELDRPEVITACDLLDEVWIKLDCATDDLFRRLNRPVTRVGGVREHLDRIRKLRTPRIQSLFWLAPSRPEVANWTAENRLALADAYRSVGAREVHLTTVQRAPAWPGAAPVPAQELADFSESLGWNGIVAKAFP